MKEPKLYKSGLVVLVLPVLVFIYLIGMSAFGGTYNLEAADTCPNTGNGWVKYDDWDDSKKSQLHDAGFGYIVTEVCVKGGQNIYTFTGDGQMFCWSVQGIGTQSATASENWVGDDKGSDCKDISHASFKVGPLSTPTTTTGPTIATPTATLTPMPTFTATPTNTPRIQ